MHIYLYIQEKFQGSIQNLQTLVFLVDLRHLKLKYLYIRVRSKTAKGCHHGNKSQGWLWKSWAGQALLLCLSLSPLLALQEGYRAVLSVP